MAKASENQYPKVTFLESAAPSTPSTGLANIYVKTDGKLYLKDDAGTETDLTASGGGAGWTLINEQTLTTDSDGHTWSSIAGTYDDLVIRYQLISDYNSGAGGSSAQIQVGNSTLDTTSGNYRWYSTGPASSSSSSAAFVQFSRARIPGTASTWGEALGELWIRDYASTSLSRYMHGSGVTFGNTSTSGVDWGQWTNTTQAIDIVKVYPDVGNWTGILQLYGVSYS